MTAAISGAALRDLAEFRAAKGCAISLYLDLDPQRAVTAGNVQTQVHSLLDVGGRSAGFESERLTRDQRQGLKDDVERIRSFFENDFDRSGMRAFALFCSGRDLLWKTLPLPGPVEDAVRLGRELYLTPLLSVAADVEGPLVAVVSRERGEVFRLRDGRLHEVANETESVPGQHDQGGLSQARYQRHVDEVVARHMRNVGEAIDRLTRQEPSIQLVIVAREEIRSEFAAALAPQTRNAICGWANAEAHATGAQLHEAIRPALAQARIEREQQALERWREESARGGRATAGWEQTLVAASDGRVELLLVQERANREAFECPSCGRPSIAGGNCPLDGTRMEARPDALDLALHRTLEHGGSVWLAQKSSDLSPVEGIGALLRY